MTPTDQPSPHGAGAPKLLPWSEYPEGTKAFAVNGGHWIKVASGWRWFNGNTFPQPGPEAFRVELPASRPAGEATLTRCECGALQVDPGAPGCMQFHGGLMARAIAPGRAADRGEEPSEEAMAKLLYAYRSACEEWGATLNERWLERVSESESAVLAAVASLRTRLSLAERERDTLKEQLAMGNS